jgi:precorrin-2 dehydrogenase/sirohydrochlorin ferrochelatase
MEEERNTAGWMPVLLNVANVRCLAVGAGTVAERRLGELLDAGARVTLISPEAAPQVAAWAVAGRLDWHKREYRCGDLDDCRPSIVLVLTDDPAVNRQVRRDAEARSIWVGDASDGLAGRLIFPASVKRGRLRLAVTTLGASPGLSRIIRRQLEDSFGAEYEPYVDFLHEMRLRFRREVPEAERRAALNRRLLTYPIPQMIRNGEFEAWRQELLRHWEETGELP